MDTHSLKFFFCCLLTDATNSPFPIAFSLLISLSLSDKWAIWIKKIRKAKVRTLKKYRITFPNNSQSKEGNGDWKTRPSELDGKIIDLGKNGLIKVESRKIHNTLCKLVIAFSWMVSRLTRIRVFWNYSKTSTNYFWERIWKIALNFEKK